MKRPFGYDIVDGKLVVNEQEMEVVRFIYSRQEEYHQNPPKELVEIVYKEERHFDKKFTMEMAREKAKGDSRILIYVTNDVNEKFGHILKRKQ